MNPLKVLPVLLLFASAASAADMAPPDRPITIAGIETACTGASLDAREDPRWQSFPLKVELAGEGGHYLGDAEFSLSQGQAPLLTVGCAGPWLLLRPPPGRYRLEARIGTQTVASSVLVPATGQSRVILRFTGE